MRLSRGTIFAGDFEIVDDKPLSEGGMGVVYVVEQVSTGKRRALKLMQASLAADKKLRDRFVQEARVGGRIESAHVVEVVSAGIDEATGSPWLAMELLDGVDLGRRVDERGALDAAEALELFEQLCHAVGSAHGAGIVHRDLKPENIFLARSKEVGGRSVVKVLDFGLAKIVAEAATQRTGAVGTPLWMAPEQTETGVVSANADVWALGLVAFYVLTARCFWMTGNRDEVSIQQIMREVLFSPIPSASERAAELGCAGKLPQPFDAWFARCVEREPANRFPDATIAFNALSLALEASAASASAPPSTVPAPAQRPPPSEPPATKAPATPRLLTQPAQPTQPLAAPLAVVPPQPHPPSRVQLATTVHPPTPTPGPSAMPSPPRRGLSPLYIAPALVVFLLVVAGLVVLSRRGGTPSHTPAASAPSSPPSHASAHALASAPASKSTSDVDVPRAEVPHTQPVVPPPEACFLSVFSTTPAKVSLDKKPLGVTPLRKVRMPVGTHVVTLVLVDQALTKDIRFTSEAGSTTVIRDGRLQAGRE